MNRSTLEALLLAALLALAPLPALATSCVRKPAMSLKTPRAGLSPFAVVMPTVVFAPFPPPPFPPLSPPPIVTTPTLYFNIILRGEQLRAGLVDSDVQALADAVCIASNLDYGVVSPVLLTYAFTVQFAMFGLTAADRTVANELAIVTTMSAALGVRSDAIQIDYYCACVCLHCLCTAPR